MGAIKRIARELVATDWITCGAFFVIAVMLSVGDAAAQPAKPSMVLKEETFTCYSWGSAAGTNYWLTCWPLYGLAVAAKPQVTERVIERAVVQPPVIIKEPAPQQPPPKKING